jgi:hypothetical protein
MKRDHRNQLRWAAAVAAAVFCAVSLSAAPQGPDKKLSAKDLAKDWLWKWDANKVGKVSRNGGGDQRLFATTIKIPGGSFEDAWTFYAEKCGADEDYSEETMLLTNGKTDKGEYKIVDNREKITGQHATLFVFAAKEYGVTVHLRRDDKMNLYLALSVTLH